MVTKTGDEHPAELVESLLHHCDTMRRQCVTPAQRDAFVSEHLDPLLDDLPESYRATPDRVAAFHATFGECSREQVANT